MITVERQYFPTFPLFMVVLFEQYIEHTVEMKGGNASVRYLSKQSHRGHRVSTLPSLSTISCFLLSAPLNINAKVYCVRTNALCPGFPRATLAKPRPHHLRIWSHRIRDGRTMPRAAGQSAEPLCEKGTRSAHSCLVHTSATRLRG